jgi:hypothetical protein
MALNRIMEKIDEHGNPVLKIANVIKFELTEDRTRIVATERCDGYNDRDFTYEEISKFIEKLKNMAELMSTKECTRENYDYTSYGHI